MLRILIATSFFLFFALTRSETATTVTRLTNTLEQDLNLNPSLSDDGRTVIFESSSDSFRDGGGGPSFHGIRAEVGGRTFIEIARGRMVSPALSSDARVVAFASREDLIGENSDRNSEIFVLDGPVLKQLTRTLNQTNFQPSISSDGQLIAFSSNGDVFLNLERLTHGESPKISGDGSRVYFRRQLDLYVIDTKTRATTLIKSAIPDLWLGDVSNDGMRIVYSATTAPNQTQVFLFDARDNSVRQLTQLGTRVTDVALQPTISGDGKRVAFATRRRVTAASDGSVELYVIDLPTGQVQQVTNAPSGATAEVTPSLNLDGSAVAFNFPRLLSGPAVDEDFENNSEIYLASIAPRAAFGDGTVLNAAALGHESSKDTHIAPGSLASFRGNSLAFATETSTKSADPPLKLAGTTVAVNGQAARMFYASPSEVIFVVPENVSAGPAEIVVTNADGFASKAQASIAMIAPGVFSVSADGLGEGVILDADVLTTAPFDPSNGQRRLSIFATGARNASSISVTIGGQSTVVETVARSNLAGLDEIHVLLPAKLAGAGTTTLIVDADGVQSNVVSVRISGLVSDKLLITQIFGGGGNAGAPFRNDFIEIFNAGSTPVNLAGWSIQYASATASTWSSTPLTSITLSPGQRYLIQQAGGSNGAPLPTPDATGTIAMAAGAGKVALVKSTTTLTGTCPNDPNIKDFVGYGSTANCFRGAGPAPAASNTNAAMRAANGCTDTRNNASDFILAPPNPRNTSAPLNSCTLVSSVLPCARDLETRSIAHALAQRRNHNFAPTLRLRRFP
jgi:uncharacterized protein (TIGR03437 family)